MKKYFFILIIAFTYCASSNAQEVDLEQFVAEKQASLEYDANKLVVAPNTKVKIIPPEYFKPDAQINGFSHPGSGSSIQVIEILNTNFNDYIPGMTPEFIESQSYNYISRTDTVTHNGTEAVIFFVRFTAGDVEYERAMLFTGDKNTIWVNANYLLSMKKLIYPAIEASLLSVE